MNGVARLSAGLAVEIVALYKDTVVTQTLDPDVTFPLQHQLDTAAYVQSET